jgi:hypothetical protein
MRLSKMTITLCDMVASFHREKPINSQGHLPLQPPLYRTFPVFSRKGYTHI